MALKPADKRVVDRFTDGRRGESKLLLSDGKKLEKLGMGGEVVARFDGYYVDWVGSASTLTHDSIYRYLKKVTPFRRFRGREHVRSSYRSLLQDIVSNRFASQDDAHRAIDEAFEAGEVTQYEARRLEGELEKVRPNSDKYSARIIAVGKDSMVPDNPTAVDAEILSHGDVVGEVTLLEDHTGKLSTWGHGWDHWADHAMQAHLDSLEDPQRAIEELVWVVQKKMQLRPNFFGGRKAKEPEDPMEAARKTREWRNKFNYYRVSEGMPASEARARADESYLEYKARQKAAAGKDVAFHRNPSHRDEDALNDEILEGFIRGFWEEPLLLAEEESGVSYYGDIPEEVGDFSFQFGEAIYGLNRRSPAEIFLASAPTEDPESFGYSLAMQSQRHGISWWDNHGREVPFQVRLPDTEAHVFVESEDDADFSAEMDPVRLNFIANR